MSIATTENGWVNTADGQTPEVIARARQLLEGTIYASLSTSSPDGLPWASPVFFTYDSDWNLYWASTIAAQHSQNLYTNQGRAMMAVYNTIREEGKGQGIFLSGIAAEVTAEDVERVIPLLLKRAATGQQRSPTDYLGASPRRLYRLQPNDIWITGERLALSETILIDTKIKLDLASLIHSA